MDKPLLCGKTAKDYKFWDNLMYHYKNLYPYRLFAVVEGNVPGRGLADGGAGAL